jgi:ABC-2 type transport system permease protein
MRKISAIFIKQIQLLVKSRGILVQFGMFLAMAFFMTFFVAQGSDTLHEATFVVMFGVMFTGMSMVNVSAILIAFDKFSKSLRFLVMAGVKPHEYLIGTGGALLVAATIILMLFGLIGGFYGIALLRFMGIMALGAAASIILGTIIGIMSKSHQGAASLSTPIGMVVGFGPMITMFDDTLAGLFQFLYTQQIQEAAMNLAGGLSRNIFVILVNIVALLVLFVLAYKKKGLRE